MRKRIKKGLQNALTHVIIQLSQGKSQKPTGRGWTWRTRWTLKNEYSSQRKTGKAEKKLMRRLVRGENIGAFPEVVNAGNSLFTFSKIAFLLIIADSESIASDKARAYITGTYTASGKAGNAKKSSRRFYGITCNNKLP